MVLILLPIIIVTEIIVVAAAYKTVSNNAYEHCYEDIEKYAAVVENIVSGYDLDNPEEAKKCSKELDVLCMKIDAPYVYAIEIDEKAQTEKYLALGFGKDATDEAKQSRYNGYVVKAELNEEILETLHDDCDDHLRRVDNKFGNTLICYRKLSNDKTNTRIIGVEKSISEVVNDLTKVFNRIFIILLVFTVIIVLSFAFIIYRKVSKPAQLVSEKMSEFASERGEDFEKLEVKGSHEFTQMAAAFNSMTDEINQYIDDIESLNREKHMQEAELNIANNIQLGLLPPADFKNHFVNMEAYILPAKEVGGDMYDYHVLDSGEICLAVADVSGKGISAALFMAHAITLLNMFGRLGLSPSKTAEEFNNTLAQNNPNRLFITAFLAKYNPKTKVLTYTNVGHNPPYIISDELKMLDGARGMAAGIFPGVTYEEAEVKLENGDALFVYTDGINEAENCKKEMLTTERLEDILKKHTGTDKKGIIADVRETICDFTVGAVQSDDITMLTLVSKKPYHKDLQLKSELQQLTVINDAIDEIDGLSFDDSSNLKLMAEEIFVNICYYSYPETTGEVEITLEADDKIKITFTDFGVPYDPTESLLDIEEYDHNNTVGGLGKFIALGLSDEYNYRYDNGKNVLTLIKNFTD